MGTLNPNSLAFLVLFCATNSHMFVGLQHGCFHFSFSLFEVLLVTFDKVSKLVIDMNTVCRLSVILFCLCPGY